MTLETWQIIYLCCIGGGLAVPLLDVLIGALGSAFDLDLDFDGDSGFDGPAPVNLMSICFGVQSAAYAFWDFLRSPVLPSPQSLGSLVATY